MNRDIILIWLPLHRHTVVLNGSYKPRWVGLKLFLGEVDKRVQQVEIGGVYSSH